MTIPAEDRDAGVTPATEGRAAASHRWRKEGVLPEVEVFRERARGECQAKGMSRKAGLQYSWDAAFAAYPPPDRPAVDIPPIPIPKTLLESTVESTVEESESIAKASGTVRGGTASTNNGHIQGINQIPEGWPPLIANANQAIEVGWTQAQRLRVISEPWAGGPARVCLDKASEPAPSWGALGWLETSIRSYAKYIDVVARTLRDEQDEQDFKRRERVAIGDIEELLVQMQEP